MDLPRHMGAGPESTGTEVEQLQLFDPQLIGRIAIEAAGPVAVSDHRHALGHRPDHRIVREHPGVRGDRLEGVCQLHKWRRP